MFTTKKSKAVSQLSAIQLFVMCILFCFPLFNGNLVAVEDERVNAVCVFRVCFKENAKVAVCKVEVVNILVQTGAAHIAFTVILAVCVECKRFFVLVNLAEYRFVSAVFVLKVFGIPDVI